jgi:Ca2+-binding EF-hand superfamily protein
MRDKSLNKAAADSSKESAVFASGIDYNATFDILDSDHSGELSVDELVTLFTSLGTYDVSPELVRNLLVGDTLKGVITKEDFAALMSQSSAKAMH